MGTSMLKCAEYVKVRSDQDTSKSPVLYAGEMTADASGGLESIDNGSGHFMPGGIINYRDFLFGEEIGKLNILGGKFRMVRKRYSARSGQHQDRYGRATKERFRSKAKVPRLIRLRQRAAPFQQTMNGVL